MKYWLLKSEPDAWSRDNQVKEGASMWDGVRNYQARNNLKEMKKNDLCFFYHSVTERSIIGIVKVVKEYYINDYGKQIEDFSRSIFACSAAALASFLASSTIRAACSLTSFCLRS